MMSYKYLIPDGKAYKITTFVSLAHIILVAWLFIGIATVVYSAYFKTGLSLIAFTVLIIVLMLLRSSKTRLFPEEKMIKIDTGVRGKEPIQYPFSDFSGFELETVYYLRLPINTELFVRFGTGETSKRHVLAQSFGKRKIQQLYNELEEILNT
ncbi:hypothetical protein [Chryseobacterium angstadtii]|nr:hypothetical protein [Chryseobacterium angstadtii]